jgi:hypothetical protein
MNIDRISRLGSDSGERFASQKTAVGFGSLEQPLMDTEIFASAHLGNIGAPIVSRTYGRSVAYLTACSWITCAGLGHA